MELGDYTLLQSLGQGSMGTAYLAEHTLMKRRYLIKVLPDELSSDPYFIARFEAHVQQLSKLEHPHIVKIHNVSYDRGSYFLVTDFVEEGKSLGSYFASCEQTLSEDEVLRIARQVASALDDAHQQSIAHGSLKLNNILISQTADGISVSISDFGLSQIIGPAAVLGRTYHTMIAELNACVGFTWGPDGKSAYAPGLIEHPKVEALHASFLQNFSFLAPEQKKSKPCDLRRADRYAFGVLLHYLMLGEYPEGYCDLPSQAEGYQWNWASLIAHCLHLDPHERPEALLMAIEQDLSATPRSSAKELLLKLRAIGNSDATAGRVQYEASMSGGTSTLTQLKPVIKPQEISRPTFEPDPGAIFQVETMVGRYQPRPQEEKAIEPLMTPMTVIPAGSYLRGSNSGCRDELPRHCIHLNPFALDVYPVSNEQFIRFLEAMGGEKDVNNNDMIRLRDSRIKRSSGKLSIESGYAKHPVVGVSWYGAVAYAKWVGKRLPTEAEWEVAAYGGNEDQIFPTGDNIERSQANFFSADTTPVMSYPPNAYGLYDLAGNVYEWCQDWYDYHYYDNSVQEPDNPQGPLQGVYRILRGGCWKSLKEDLRCAHRHRNNPGIMNGTYGFRCAADVADEGSLL